MLHDFTAPRAMPVALRIGIACSGLGRINRGNEVSSEMLARGLAGRGLEPRLYGGGPPGISFRRYVRVFNLPRESGWSRGWLAWSKRYLLEQWTFSIFLKRHLAADPVDILHVPDPALADWMQRWPARKNMKVIYKDGLLLGPPWCRRFQYIIVLAPHYLEHAKAAGINTDHWSVIPHMVDIHRFSPAPDPAAIRQQLFGGRLPKGAFAIAAVGDFSAESGKRLSWIVNEIRLLPRASEVHLIVAGHCHGPSGTDFVQKTRATLGERAHILENIPSAEMPNVYRAADVFAHAALREPFGIVFLEAMASGLPLVGHPFETTRWIIGNAGATLDMTQPGRLSALVQEWHGNPELCRTLKRAARDRAISQFSPEKIIPLYFEMYAKMTAASA